MQSVPVGAHTKLSDLIRLRFDARKLREASSVRPQSNNVGTRQSRQRARGIDFEEVRLYQQGDDVRTIDWRVTARTSTPHTKVFRAERDRPLFLVIDQRQSMFFGSRNCCKSVQAAHLASLLAWGAYHRGDQVGGCVLGNAHFNEVRPCRGYRAVLQLLHFIDAHNNSLKLDTEKPEHTPLEHVLSNIRKSLRPGTSVFIISDGHDLDTDSKHMTAHLHYLVQHCQLTWLHISDVMERNMPTHGRYLFTNGRQRTEWHMEKGLRNIYSKQFVTHLQHISNYLSGLRISLTSIDTTDAPLTVLTGRKRTKQGIVPTPTAFA